MHKIHMLEFAELTINFVSFYINGNLTWLLIRIYGYNRNNLIGLI